MERACATEVISGGGAKSGGQCEASRPAERNVGGMPGERYRVSSESSAGSAEGRPAETVEERIKVDRRKMELLISGHLSECRMSGPEFFLAVMRQTDTVVSWPERLKIGSKSKKDPQVKIEGLPINVGVAKEMIMQVLDVKKDQVTLRMDISYTDHSHLIGKKGETIQKVKSDTDCHIHFPDSNRNGVVKSNRVTLTGMAENVERAKLAIRKLMPIVLKLLIPSRCLNEKNQTVFSDILRSIRERHLSFKFNPPADSIRILVIRGQRAEKEKFEEILGNIDRLVASNRQDEIAMEIEMAISHNNNFFKKDLPNNPILNRIMQSTNTTIKMLFLNQNNDVTKSTIHILGRKFENVYKGWQEVMDHLPLSVEFSVDANRIIDTVTLNRLFQVLNISINIKSKTRHTEKTVIITSYEKFSKILFEIRKYLLNEKILSIQIPDMLQRNSIEYSRNLNEALLRLEKSTGYHTNLQLNNYAPTMLYSSNFYPDIWSTQPYLPVSPDSTPDTSPRNSPMSNLSDNKEDTFGSVVRNSVQDNSNYIHVCTNIWCNHEKCIKLDMDKLESEFDTIWRNGQSSTSEIKTHNSGNNRENLNGREIKQFDYGLKMWAFNAMKQNPVGSQKRRPTNFWCGGGFSKSMYDVHYPSIPSYICPFQLRRVERDSKSEQTQSSVGLTSHKVTENKYYLYRR
ncbi:protein bicaudal C homolog 1-B-like isoform X2 [Centruroides vittatus]|uniref:protein bicaudal C homolog 1-B-like isoform X2 n=1 Tax=Centruroides vittatus TaxID=120091 RepID=UPI00350FA08E